MLPSARRCCATRTSWFWGSQIVHAFRIVHFAALSDGARLSSRVFGRVI